MSLAIVGLAAVLRFWALDFGLPNLMARPDEASVVREIVRVAEAKESTAFVNYPGGYVYLSWLWGEVGLRLAGAEGYTAVSRSEPQRVFIAGRTLSATAGVACVCLLMLVTRREMGDAPALLAGLLLATNFLHVRDSHAMKPDALVTLAGVAALAAMARLARRHTARHAIVAGLMLGWAMAMKWPAVLLLAPLYIATVQGSLALGWRRLFPESAVIAAVCAAGIFLMTSHYLIFDTDNLTAIFDGLVMIFSPKLEASSDAHGFPPASIPSGFENLVAYHALFSFRYGAGALVTLLAPAAVAWGFVSRRSLPFLAAIYLSVHYFVVSLGNQAFSRFMDPVMPVVALLEAGMLGALLTRYAPRYLSLGLVVAAGLLVAEPLSKTLAHNRVISRVDTRVQASRWLAENLESGTVVAVVGQSLGAWGMPQVSRPLKVLRRLDLDPRRLQEASVNVLVSHDHPLPFSTIDPGEMARLAPRLHLLAEFDPFTNRKSEAIFEPADAYYVPIHGLAGVERAGPHVFIYAFE